MGILTASKPGVLDAVVSAHPGSVKVTGHAVLGALVHDQVYAIESANHRHTCSHEANKHRDSCGGQEGRGEEDGEGRGWGSGWGSGGGGGGPFSCPQDLV